MPSPFDEAEKQYKQTQQPAAGAGGNPFDQAEKMLKAPGTSTGSGLTATEKEENARPIDFKAMRRDAMPAIGGLLGAAAVTPFTGGLGTVPAFLAGTAAAGAGGGLFSGIEQGIEKATQDPAAPKTAGEALKRTGQEAGEQALYEAGGRVLSGTLSKVLGRYLDPERLYQSGLKPTGSRESNVAGHIKTGIAEKIPLNEEARGVIGKRIDALNGTLERMIQSSPSDIPPQQYVNNIQGKLDQLRQQWGKDATHGRQFVERIDDMEREFLLQHGNPQPIVKQIQTPVNSGVLGPNGKPLQTMQTQTITIEPDKMTLAELRRQARPLNTLDAQGIKKQTYETIRTANKTAWDTGKHPGLDTRASKEISRALREELENAYANQNFIGANGKPMTIKEINRRLGNAIGLEEQIDRFVKREMNRQITSMTAFGLAGAAIGGHFGGMEGGGGGALAGVLLRKALEDPAIKSRIAIALSSDAGQIAGRAAKKVVKQVPRLTGVAYGASNNDRSTGQNDSSQP